jgi:DNA repair protein RecO (recombination protein O)
VASGRALCLRRVPFGDSSLVVELLTEQHGRVGLLARGAYRLTSRFAGVLDLFHRLELSWRPAAPGALGLLIAGDTDRSRRRVPSSLASYRAGLAALELAELCSRSGQPEPGLFRLLDGTLEALDSGADPDAELLRFDLCCLAEIGLAPALRRCAACGRRASPAADPAAPAWFDPAAGGRLCPDCRRHSDGAVATRATWLENLASLGEDQARLRGAFPGLEQARALLERLLERQLESPLRARGRR